MRDRLVTPALQVDLNLESGARVRHGAVTVSQLVVAGWTGRDPAAVERHIVELEALGVARPASTPILYRVASARLPTYACRPPGAYHGPFKSEGGLSWLTKIGA